jgi:hypothetical protein
VADKPIMNGDQFCSGSLIWTLKWFTTNAECTECTGVVLSHPLMEDWWLSTSDFKSALERHLLTREGGN